MRRTPTKAVSAWQSLAAVVALGVSGEQNLRSVDAVAALVALASGYSHAIGAYDARLDRLAHAARRSAQRDALEAHSLLSRRAQVRRRRTVPEMAVRATVRRALYALAAPRQLDVKVRKGVLLVRDKGAKVRSDDAMPCATRDGLRAQQQQRRA